MIYSRLLKGVTKSLHTSYPVTCPTSIPACPDSISPLSEQNLYIHRVTSIRSFPEGRRQRLRGWRGPARRRPGGRSVPQARRGCVASPQHRAGAAARRPLLLPPLPRGARPASPSQMRSRRCRFTLCRSMGRAGPRRPRRRGRTRDPSLATRAAPTEPERRGWAHASGIAATEGPRASASGPRTWGVRGERDRAGPGRSRLFRYSRLFLSVLPAHAGFGPAGAAGSGPGGWLKKLGGGSWDVASGLRKLSVHGTKQGAVQIGSASVLSPLQAPSHTCPVLLGVDQRCNTCLSWESTT